MDINKYVQLIVVYMVDINSGFAVLKFACFVHLQVLNLFLALLLNAFASDTLREAKESQEDTKLKIAFKRLFDLCCCCFKKKKNSDVNSITPTPEDGELGSVEEIHEKTSK